MTLLDKTMAAHEKRLAESLDVTAGLHRRLAESERLRLQALDGLTRTVNASSKIIKERDARIAELEQHLADSSAAGDELREMVTAGAKMIAQRDKEIAHLKACLALAEGRINKVQDAKLRRRITDWEQQSGGIVTGTEDVVTVRLTGRHPGLSAPYGTSHAEAAIDFSPTKNRNGDSPK